MTDNSPAVILWMLTGIMAEVAALAWFWGAVA